MIKLRHLCLPLIALCLPAAVLAEEGAEHGITYDCDTAADHFSDLSLPTPAGPFTVTGRVKLMSVAKSKTFVTMTRLVISEYSAGDGPPNKGWAGLEFMVGPGGKKNEPSVALLGFSARKLGDENNTEDAWIPASTEVGFSLSYDGTKVSVSADGHSKALEFVANEPIVRIVCSTGEFLYRDLKIKPVP